MLTRREAAQWLMGALGAPYEWWLSGPVSQYDGPPAWAVNAPAPDISEVDRGFCVAVVSLIQRKMDVPIPPSPWGEGYDGGTVSTYEYYYDESLWYADRAREGFQDFDMLLAPFREDGSSQGHAAVVVFYGDEPYVLEWITNGGLVWDYTPEYSNTWGHYEIVVPADVWLPTSEHQEPVKPPERTTSVLTEELLLKAMTSSSFSGPDLTPADAKAFLPSIKKYCTKYAINDRARFSAWLGEMGAESGSFQWWEEFGRGEGRFGDYYGRGPGQLTWEDTYREFAEATGWDAYNNPGIVGDHDNPECGFEACCWLWDGKGLNAFADEATWDSYSEITYRWLGAYEHPSVPERNARYAHAWNVLPGNLDFTLEGEPDVPPEPEERDVSFATYTFCAYQGQPTEIANTAVLVLESMDYDCMAVGGDKNIREVSRQAYEVGDMNALNAVVVGQEAYTRLDPAAKPHAGWNEDSTVWHMSAVGEFIFVRNYCIPWISKGDELAQTLFDNILLSLDRGTYESLIAEAKEHEPVTPEPPNLETLEQRVAALEKWRKESEAERGVV